MFKGNINKDTGDPEIISVSPDKTKEEVIAHGYYTDFAFSSSEIEGTFMVFGDYWSSKLPADMIGKLVEVKRELPKPIVEVTEPTIPDKPASVPEDITISEVNFPGIGKVTEMTTKLGSISAILG